MNDRDHLMTVRELLRDAIEVARTAGTATTDPTVRAVWERGRDGLSSVLSEFDDLASRPPGPAVA